MSETSELVRERYGVDVDVADMMNETLRSILSHQTCRAFSDKPIDDQTLRLLISCAQSAPTKSNLQQYSIIVVRDADLRRRMGDLVPSMAWLATAPVALVFLGDLRRIRELAKLRGHDYQNDNVDTFMNGAVDAAVAMQNLIVAAESIGLGTCPVSYVRNRLDDLAEILSLPDGVFPICTLTIGHPVGRRRASMRLAQDIVVHQDKYDDHDLSDEITSYDDRAHERFAIAPEKQRHTDKYGVLEKCTWSENVTRQLSLPERPEFRDYLARKKISLD
jgi:FMN reductase [NAD(P)H]